MVGNAIELDPKLTSIFANEWFFRIWTIQEFMLASDLILCCGHQTVNWKSFHYYYESIEDKHLTSNFGFLVLLRWAYMDALATSREQHSSTTPNEYAAPSTRLYAI